MFLSVSCPPFLGLAEMDGMLQTAPSGFRQGGVEADPPVEATTLMDKDGKVGCQGRCIKSTY